MDTKNHIQEVALKLFAEKGFDGASVRDIAKEANVNIAMISYYFKSKESLLESFIDDVIRIHLSSLDQIMKKEITPLEKLLLIINHSINEIIDNYQRSKILAFEGKLNKRKNIAHKAKNLTFTVYTLMKKLIMQHNSKISGYKADIIPLMIHTTLFEFVSDPSIIDFLSKGEISNLHDPDKRSIIKEHLIKFMEDTTIRLIS